MTSAKEFARQIHLAGIDSTVDKVEEPDEALGLDGSVQVTGTVHVQVGCCYSCVVVQNEDDTYTFHPFNEGPDHVERTIENLKEVLA